MARILLADSRLLFDEALEALLPDRGEHETKVLVLGDHGGASRSSRSHGDSPGPVR